MSEMHAIQPSSSIKPDLDWSQVRQTVLMLNLAVAQIENALSSGDDSVNSLAESFTSMVGDVEEAYAAVKNLSENQETQAIRESCESVSGKMQHAIIAFQFYDKLTQRLTHLSNSLSALSELVSDQQKLYNPYAWHGLQEQIKSKYTVEADKQMFEAILAGKTVSEALAESQTVEKSGNGDDVELF